MIRPLAATAAEVLDEVSLLDEGRQADPLGPFAAHLGDAEDFPDAFLGHERDDGVTADARSDERAFGHLGARRVGAARTEPRHPLGGAGDGDGDSFPGCRSYGIAEAGGQARLEQADQGGGAEGPVAGDERRAVLVEPPDDRRAAPAPSEERQDLVLDQLAAFLDHDELVDAGPEALEEAWPERIGHADLG